MKQIQMLQARVYTRGVRVDHFSYPTRTRSRWCYPYPTHNRGYGSGRVHPRVRVARTPLVYTNFGLRFTATVPHLTTMRQSYYRVVLTVNFHFDIVILCFIVDQSCLK